LPSPNISIDHSRAVAASKVETTFTNISRPPRVRIGTTVLFTVLPGWTIEAVRYTCNGAISRRSSDQNAKRRASSNIPIDGYNLSPVLKFPCGRLRSCCVDARLTDANHESCDRLRELMIERKIDTGPHWKCEQRGEQVRSRPVSTTKRVLCETRVVVEPGMQVCGPSLERGREQLANGREPL
jgi:hypothetical protein